MAVDALLLPRAVGRRDVCSSAHTPTRPDTHPQAPKRRAWEALTGPARAPPLTLGVEAPIHNEKRGAGFHMLISFTTHQHAQTKLKA